MSKSLGLKEVPTLTNTDRFLYRKTPAKSLTEIDLFEGKAEIDREEEEFLANKAARLQNSPKRGRFYKVFVSWLF